MNHVTIATSSGFVWLALVSHFGTGLIALVAGAIALAVAKGGRLHKQSGLVFALAMIATGLIASSIAYFEKAPTFIGGIFTAYLIFTATATVKPAWSNRRLDIALMLLATGLAIFQYRNGIAVWSSPGHIREGVPGGMVFFLATVNALAAIGDMRMLYEGGLKGARRLARHLWRMCFGLFIATGSFFLGQMKFIPASVRFMPLIWVLAIGPLLLLVYWMWRVRMRRRLSGLIIRAPEVVVSV